MNEQEAGLDDHVRDSSRRTSCIVSAASAAGSVSVASPHLCVVQLIVTSSSCWLARGHHWHWSRALHGTVKAVDRLPHCRVRRRGRATPTSPAHFRTNHLNRPHGITLNHSGGQEITAVL